MPGRRIGMESRKEEERAEELKKGRRVCREEEEEDREMDAYRLRLEYMYEHCSKYDREICRLLEEQWEMLNSLGFRKKEFKDTVLSRYLSWHISYTMI